MSRNSPNLELKRILAERGIAMRMADVCHLQYLSAAEHASLMGSLEIDVPAIGIWYFDAEGQPTNFFRTKLLGTYTPKGAKKAAKYLSLKGSTSRLYFPPVRNWKETFSDVSVPIMITEGELKSIKACQEGLACIAIGGVWNWRTREDDDSSSPIDDLNLIEWKGRTVHIVFDSDAATNPNVQRAESSLARELYSRMAKPYIVRLPRISGTAKTGLDDWLLHNGKNAKSELSQLLNDSISPFIPSISTTRELANMKFKDPEFVIEGLIIKGLSMLSASPKIGKSFMALQMAHAVATGEVAFGAYPTKVCDVLYIALEDTKRRIKKRLEDMHLGPTDRLRVTHSWPRGKDPYEILDRFLEENPAVKLVIIDTFQRFRKPSNGRSQNAYEQDYAELAQIKQVADHRGVAILFIHHLKKGITGDIFESVSGSTAITGAMDTNIVIKRDRNSPDATLYITGRDIFEQELAFGFEDGMWKFIGLAYQHRISSERQRIIEILTETRTPIRLSDLADAISARRDRPCSPQNARKMLRGLIEAGIVSQTEGGLYKLNKNEDPKKYV